MRRRRGEGRGFRHMNWYKQETCDMPHTSRLVLVIAVNFTAANFAIDVLYRPIRVLNLEKSTTRCSLGTRLNDLFSSMCIYSSRQFVESGPQNNSLWTLPDSSIVFKKCSFCFL